MHRCEREGEAPHPHGTPRSGDHAQHNIARYIGTLMRLRAAGVRQLCTPSSSVRATVTRLAGGASDLNTDLAAKFDLLTKCETEFGLQMPHIALNDVHNVDDAVRYWETRLEAERDAQLAAEQHFTRNLPPNVVITGHKDDQVPLSTWMHGKSLEARRIERHSAEDERISESVGQEEKGSVPF